MPRLRRAIVFALKLAFSLAFTVVLLEFTLRAYHRVNPSFFFPSTSYNRFRGKPLARHFDDRLNSRGFNDDEFSAEKPVGSTRVALIGDSLVFGTLPRRFHFSKLLEEKLRKDGRAIELLNLGIPGIAVQEYVSVLVNEALPLQPDVVVCFFFVGNDFIERAAARDSPWFVVSLYRYLFNVLPAWRGGRYRYTGYQDARPSIRWSAFLNIEKLVIRIFRTDHPTPSELDRASSALREMKAICDVKGIRFFVTLIPDELQVSPEARAKVEAALRLDPADFEYTHPNRLLGAELARSGIEFLDLLDPFVEAGRGERLYKPQDTHWNIAGNRLATELLRDTLIFREKGTGLGGK